MRSVVLSLAAILMAAIGTASLPAQVVCDDINVPPLIPAAGTDGLTQEFVVTSPGMITDLDVYLRVIHSSVGLLTVRLEHVDSRTSVTLVNRPGWNGGDGEACTKWDLDVMLDDDGPGGLVDDQCANSATVFYPSSPPSYTPHEALSAFNGLPAAGTWRLTVTDVGLETVGALHGWCLLFDTVPFADIERSKAETTSIPDNNPGGIYDQILIPEDVMIADINVHLNIRHTWVGDLIVTLEHVATGTQVDLLRRPLAAGASTFGCSRDDIYMLLDDEGTGGDANDVCMLTAAPYYAKSPPAYVPAGSLSAFNGLSAKGHWRLRVSDNAAGDTGALRGWSLHITPAPEYEIPPHARAIGDFNNDSCVNFADFLYMLDKWGVAVDGTPIGFGDFISLLNNWGGAC